MATPATGVLTITNAREAAAAALAPIASDDPDVLTSLVDAVSPPVLMVGWDDPWLEPRGTCRFSGRLAVWCIAGRLEPGSGVATLEDLTSYAISRLQADGYSWGLPTVTAPRIFPVGGIDYLAARVTYGIPVAINEGG
jgi:hypothetical protein